jgi:hypothetical protein
METIRSQLRLHGPTEHLTQEKLDALASLFGDGPGRLDTKNANNLTDLYVHYYWSAEPFRPEALRAAWRGCTDAECTRARLAAGAVTAAAARYDGVAQVVSSAAR